MLKLTLSNEALIDLRLLDSSEKSWLKDGITWAETQQRTTGADTPTDMDLIKKTDELCAFSSPTEKEAILEGLKWMGLFSQEPPSLHGNLLDTLSAQLNKLCSFQPGERDLAVVQHRYVVKWTDGSGVSNHKLLPPFSIPTKL